jgi:hypothetical protein
MRATVEAADAQQSKARHETVEELRTSDKTRPCHSEPGGEESPALRAKEFQRFASSDVFFGLLGCLDVQQFYDAARNG